LCHVSRASFQRRCEVNGSRVQFCDQALGRQPTVPVAGNVWETNMPVISVPSTASSGPVIQVGVDTPPDREEMFTERSANPK
jgi:hypothetical protein